MPEEILVSALAQMKTVTSAKNVQSVKNDLRLNMVREVTSQYLSAHTVNIKAKNAGGLRNRKTISEPLL